MTLSINLDGAPLTALQAHADQMGMPLEAFAKTVLVNFAAIPSERIQNGDDSFERAAHYVLTKNKELYERLAR